MERERVVGVICVWKQNEAQIDKARYGKRADITRKTEFNLQKPRKMKSNCSLPKSGLFLVTIVLFK